MQGRIMVLLAALMAGAGCRGDAGDEPAEVQEVEAPRLDPALAAHLPEGVPIEVAAEGGELYPLCGVCHGMEGEGTALGPPLNDPAALPAAGIDGIADVIRAGVSSPAEFPVPMPAYGPADFTGEQVRALSAYVYLLGRRGETPR